MSTRLAMMGMQYHEIVSKIHEAKGISEDEIHALVKEKLTKLSDLVSKEGAAHIVANELGVKIFDAVRARTIKINQLVSGMRSVTFFGQVTKLFPVNSFNKNGRQGKVASMFVSDDTGRTRVVFWDTNHIQQIEQGSIIEGTILKITNAYVKSNNAFTEVHLGAMATLEINPEGLSVPVVATQPSFGFEVKKIVDLRDDDANIGITGTLVQVFEPRFYAACPKCGKKAQPQEAGFQCGEHGAVAAEYVPILNLFLDDGTENIRAVAFRNQAERILHLPAAEIQQFRENPTSFEMIKGDLLGKQFTLVGRVTRNEMMDRREFMVKMVQDVEPAIEAVQIVRELRI